MANDVLELNLDDLNPYKGERSILLAENPEGLWKGLIIDPNETTLTPDGILAIYDNRIVVADAGSLGQINLIGDVVGSGQTGIPLVTALSENINPSFHNLNFNWQDTSSNEFGCHQYMPDIPGSAPHFVQTYWGGSSSRWLFTFHTGSAIQDFGQFSLNYWYHTTGDKNLLTISPLTNTTYLKTVLDLDGNSIKNLDSIYPSNTDISFKWPTSTGFYSFKNDMPDDVINTREFVHYHTAVDGITTKRSWYTRFNLGVTTPITNVFKLHFWDDTSGLEKTPLEISTSPTEYINLNASTVNINAGLNLNNNTIVNGRAADPTGGVDTAIATKKYVDDNSGGGGGGGTITLTGAVTGSGTGTIATNFSSPEIYNNAVLYSDWNTNWRDQYLPIPGSNSESIRLHRPLNNPNTNPYTHVFHEAYQSNRNPFNYNNYWRLSYAYSSNSSHHLNSGKIYLKWVRSTTGGRYVYIIETSDSVNNFHLYSSLVSHTNINLSGNYIENVCDPTEAHHVVTKNHLDTQIKNLTERLTQLENLTKLNPQSFLQKILNLFRRKK